MLAIHAPQAHDSGRRWSNSQLVGRGSSQLLPELAGTVKEVPGLCAGSVASIKFRPCAGRALPATLWAFTPRHVHARRLLEVGMRPVNRTRVLLCISGGDTVFPEFIWKFGFFLFVFQIRHVSPS